MKMTFQEIRIIATGPCIANQLRDVNTICRRSWNIAAHVWKIYDFKIEVVALIINFSTELTTVVKFEVYFKIIPTIHKKYRKQNKQPKTKLVHHRNFLFLVVPLLIYFFFFNKYILFSSFAK